ncbi:MAG: glycoside hydrolase family 2 protein [Candidatus Methylacidiphilales bacterium]|nr:glycoside hydrolase family 2 TIM barrel-domain containing protein [Candidatus Methylacidiphilales bacterium]
MQSTTVIPRLEYPRPQCVRTDWLCLNGQWEFETDQGDSGEERGLLTRPLVSQITVPFCPESVLSGIANTDFLNAVWYRRTVQIPSAWEGRSVLLHFQAVDYDATVWVNGTQVGSHRGGFTPFACNLTGVAEAGQKAEIVVRARDNATDSQPRGKQTSSFGKYGCLYTRVTGIWQSVWLEPVNEAWLGRPRVSPNISRGIFLLELPLSGNRKSFAVGGGVSVHATVKDEDGSVIAEATQPAEGFSVSLDLQLPADRRRLWSPEDPFLHDIDVELVGVDGNVIDKIRTYGGLRSVSIDGYMVKINGRSVFQRLVLDQGWYEDGLLTAPSDEALKRDIQLSLEAGFNGARLHQKVFEERFLYHADKMGYLVWGEFPDWDCVQGPHHDHHQKFSTSYVGEWLEAVERDYSHPSIIGWCPMNESYERTQGRISALEDAARAMFFATKALDKTRPVLDASGYSHRVPDTDIYDSHDYDQDPESFRARHAGAAAGNPFINNENGSAWCVPYHGQPYFVSEFGGIWWNPAARPGDASWGYGKRPVSIEEFYARFEGLCAALLDNAGMFGYCYTQLTDVFQEQNGIYGFDRSLKFDMARIRAAQILKAAIEE